MLFMKTQHIQKNQVGLRFRKGDLHQVLGPGEHRFFGRKSLESLEIYNRLSLPFLHPLLGALVEDPMLSEYLDVIELEDHERALVWQNGCLKWILGAGLHAFWKSSKELRIERFDIGSFYFQHPKLSGIMNHPDFPRFMAEIHVPAHTRGLMFHKGEFVRILEPGVYAVWKEAGRYSATLVDQRETTLDVSGQEIMTSDKVSLRLNLLVNFQVQDSKLAVFQVENFAQAVYKEAQLILRAAVGTRTLDALLADKEAIGSQIGMDLKSRCAEFGIAIRSVGVRDIILPGEMKDLLNQVTEAQKAAEANLIKRREETAAVRSQVNTAKLMAENPQLIRMKELETMQEIMSGARVSFFIGSGDMKGQLQDLLFTEKQES